jgi:hypothetical protein
MSDNYIEHKINLSENQKKNLVNAIKNKVSLTLRISKNSLNGDVPILLTKSQKSNIDKAIQNKTANELTLSNEQLQQQKIKYSGFLLLWETPYFHMVHKCSLLFVSKLNFISSSSILTAASIAASESLSIKSG